MMGGILGSLLTLAGPPIEGVVVEVVEAMVGTEGTIADVVEVTLVTVIVVQEVGVVTVVQRDAGQDLEVIPEVKETHGETEVGAGLEEVVATIRMGEVTREETEATRGEKIAATPEEKEAEAGAGQGKVEETPRMRGVTLKEKEVIQEKSAVTPEENEVRVIPVTSLDQEVGANPADTQF